MKVLKIYECSDHSNAYCASIPGQAKRATTPKRGFLTLDGKHLFADPQVDGNKKHGCRFIVNDEPNGPILYTEEFFSVSLSVDKDKATLVTITPTEGTEGIELQPWLLEEWEQKKFLSSKKEFIEDWRKNAKS